MNPEKPDRDQSSKTPPNHRRSPKERLQACVENTLENRDVLARGGCPFGTPWDFSAKPLRPCCRHFLRVCAARLRSFSALHQFNLDASRQTLFA